ncbi:Phosphoribulokinase, plasmid [Pluralibacter gergoviae]|nr:Phosphoribulokinase, plasmid [Pluralibacter gergoviae]
MSAKYPVIAVTGSSGAGTTTTSLAFRKIFAQLNLQAAEVEGDSFHRYTRPEMDMAIRKARDLGRHISYFWPGRQRLRFAGAHLCRVRPARQGPVA